MTPSVVLSLAFPRSHKVAKAFAHEGSFVLPTKRALLPDAHPEYFGAPETSSFVIHDAEIRNEQVLGHQFTKELESGRLMFGRAQKDERIEQMDSLIERIENEPIGRLAKTQPTEKLLFNRGKTMSKKFSTSKTPEQLIVPSKRKIDKRKFKRDKTLSPEQTTGKKEDPTITVSVTSESEDLDQIDEMNLGKTV